LYRSGTASVSDMNRRSKRRIAPSINQGRLLTPSNLEEQFRELQRLRKLVDELEKSAEQNASGVRSATTQRREK